MANAPDYSIIGGLYLGAPASVTIEGHPWEIMRANDLVYDFITGTVVKTQTIKTKAALYNTSNYSISDGLVSPGSIMKDGSRVMDYAAWYSFDTGRFKYSEVILE
jgi:hypothetical protein